jgi:hypothetical protein
MPIPCQCNFAHPCVNVAVEKSLDTGLPCIELECILSMGTKPREIQLSLQSNNFCQDVQKKHVKTFVTCV